MPENLPQGGPVAVVKRDCPTCVLAAPVLGDLARQGELTVYTQDDPSFPETVPALLDRFILPAGDAAPAGGENWQKL
jgi:hypothetical protein